MKKVHFIGIGGISMSALALELKRRGAVVSGSDLTLSDITGQLEAEGIHVFEGHDAANIAGADLVVKNSAIKEDNPELAAARQKGIEVIERAFLLGKVMEGFKKRVAVAGMHGKTTATGLIASVLKPLAPALHIGGELVEKPTSQKDEIFVTEACEYCRNFLHLSPDIAVILNIDGDHPDYFRDIEDTICAFEQFAQKIREGGKLVVNGDDPNCAKIDFSSKLTFGLGEGNDFVARDISCNRGRYSFSVEGQRIDLGIYGKHQIYNALAAFAVGKLCGLSAEDIKQGMENFCGVRRRFELYPKKLCGADVILDYAHHPKEIKALLAGVREIGYQKIYCVFQPHTYSRTEALLEEFAACFEKADCLILMPVYAAREKEGAVNSQTLVRAIKNPSVLYIEEGKDVIKELEGCVQKKDAVLLVGAGNIVDICKFI